MKIKSFIFNKMKENGFVVWDEADGSALLIDPGCVSDEEHEELDSFLRDNSLKPIAVLATHPHFDHIAGAERFCHRYGMECYVCEADRILSDRQEELARLYDFQLVENSAPTHYFTSEKQVLHLGRFTVEVLPISGHTPGSVAFYIAEAKAVFVGDTIIKGSLGFQETGFKETLENIRDYLLPLPDEVRMFPGHGDFSTIGEERLGNRFFKRSANLV